MPVGWVAWVMEKDKNAIGCKILDYPTKGGYIDERIKRLVQELRASDDDYTVQILEEIAVYIMSIEDHPILDQAFYRLEEAILWYQTWSDLIDEDNSE
jgi:hypothetical protein